MREGTADFGLSESEPAPSSLRGPYLRYVGRTVASWTLWPLIVAGGLWGTGLALETAHPVAWFNVVYLAVILTIAAAERLLPYERAWQAKDGESFNNVAHTLLNKGLVQIGATAALSLSMMVATEVAAPEGSKAGLWPSQWPMVLQVILGLIVAELGLYAAHRVAHEWRPLWRFHALHHSVTKLWFLNTGRFHFMDTALKIGLSQPALYLLGAPLPVYIWISGVTAFVGLLTHCNIDLNTRPFDLIFSTPRLHRWHHSKRLEEGDKNYGENLMLWDWVFGTYYNPRRRPPVDIGIPGRIARGFVPQLIQPFTRRGVAAIHEKRYPAQPAE